MQNIPLYPPIIFFGSAFIVTWFITGLKKSSRVKKKPVAAAAKTTDKEHVNVVFIGHVDAGEQTRACETIGHQGDPFLKTGKSTIGGQIMYLTNMVDKRTLEKYEKEAKEINRETWYLSWCMDTNAEERNKGKTVEVSNKKTDILDMLCQAHFYTPFCG